ncbi:MAG: hypothetical protein PSX37_03500 [bacterium]|nr:hypothetical protein [bacterium]
MPDFDIVNVPLFLNQRVDTCDQAGNLIPDDGAYQARGAETQFVFAEFLKAKGLVAPEVSVTRRPDLIIKFSQLTDEGRAFSRAALDKWMRSLDRDNSKPVEAAGLERHWKRFSAAQPTPR